MIHMEHNCYMTLITKEDFLPCVIRCSQALKYLGSKYPYIAMIPNNNEYIKNQLELNEVLYKEIEVLKFNENDSSNYFNDTINKFQILTFTEFDKICFLDADILMIQHIDEEFDKFNNIKNNFKTFGCAGGVWGGLFFCKPNLLLYKEILDKTKNDNYYDEDQKTLIEFIPYKDIKDVRHVPGNEYHFGGKLKPWAPNSTKYIYLRDLFLSMTKNEFFSVLKSLELKGYFLEYIYDNTYLNRYIYAAMLEKEEDVYKVQKLIEKFNSLGIYHPFAYIIRDGFTDVTKYFAPSQQFRLIKNENIKGFLGAFGCYDKVCFINNLDINLEDNLDCLFSNTLNDQIKNNLLNKYNNDIKIIDIESLRKRQ